MASRYVDHESGEVLTLSESSPKCCPPNQTRLASEGPFNMDKDQCCRRDRKPHTSIRIVMDFPTYDKH
jgi:hypothetical protein